MGSPIEVEAPLGVSGCDPLRPLEWVVSLCASLKLLTPKCHNTKLSAGLGSPGCRGQICKPPGPRLLPCRLGPGQMWKSVCLSVTGLLTWPPAFRAPICSSVVSTFRNPPPCPPPDLFLSPCLTFPAQNMPWLPVVPPACPAPPPHHRFSSLA